MIRLQHLNVFKFSLILFFLFILPFESNLLAQRTGKTPGPSCPEKWWAVLHPLVAKKAHKLTLYSLFLTDSVKNTLILDGNMSGGQLDAFKHSCWMAVLSSEIGWKKALKLGHAHERGNYKAFKKAKRKGLENSHDKISSEMDLWNNEQGIQIAQNNPELKLDQFVEIIIDAILSGKMKIIKTDNNGVFLDKDDQMIREDNLQGKWENLKVLVPSDYLYE